jgi:glycosyltransferase involved in cell wall biosynthesis
VRIVHVVTLVSADGAYGGPLSVARSLTSGLADRGHDVVLIAGWDGRAALDIPGVRVDLHRIKTAVPGTGFAGLVAPGLLGSLRELAESADVVHVHLARDLISMPAARTVASLGRPLVVQTHGMVRPDRRFRSRVMDAVLTRRVLASARAQLVLTPQEEQDAPEVTRAHVWTPYLTNGVTLPVDRASWDASVVPEVLFMARLHERKRPLVFVDMAAELLSRGFEGNFSIYGPDEGQLTAVLAHIRGHQIGGHVTYRGPLASADVLRVFARAQVYVLPSLFESFPMAVLEAMSCGLPTIITNSNGLAEHVKRDHSATVTDGSPSALADAVQMVLSSPEEWQAASSRARDAVATRFRADDVVERLERIYLKAVGG